MRITFCGAAGEVTGSQHLLEVNGQRILLDCGMFQGRREEANRKNRDFIYDPESIDVVVLSHAHIDHSGNLPALVHHGFRGPIYTTSATRSLCSVMLMDSAKIQESDAEWYNRKAEKWKVKPIEPLYRSKDVLRCLDQFVSINYNMTLPIAPGVKVTFRDAGHVLGSASVTLDIEENGQPPRRVVFSGDVGRAVTPLLREPVPAADDAEIVLIETTYGNRDHEPYEEASEQVADTIRRTIKRGGKVITPTFALERAQEVVFTLRRLLHEKRIPKIPIYVDSPLTFDITQIFRLHPEYFDEEVTKLYVKHESPFYFPGLTYIRDVRDSKALNNRNEPMMIMSASGMCEAGRILHHLRNNIGDSRNTVMFVGYQAENTLGRKILEGHQEVNIFGRPHDVHAEVVAINSLSGHADRGGLAEWIQPAHNRCKRVFLVHGERDQSEPFRENLRQLGFEDVDIPERGTTVEL